jgi:hypothetical protein
MISSLRHSEIRSACILILRVRMVFSGQHYMQRIGYGRKNQDAQCWCALTHSFEEDLVCSEIWVFAIHGKVDHYPSLRLACKLLPQIRSAIYFLKVSSIVAYSPSMSICGYHCRTPSCAITPRSQIDIQHHVVPAHSGIQCTMHL